MIYRDGINVQIENFKKKLGLIGDVYLVKEHEISDLINHKILIPSSTATTIEEAEAERIAYEAEQEALRAQMAQETEEFIEQGEQP